MDSQLLLKFIGYFPDYLSALSRTFTLFLDNLCRHRCIPNVAGQKHDTDWVSQFSVQQIMFASLLSTHLIKNNDNR